VLKKAFAAHHQGAKQVSQQLQVCAEVVHSLVACSLYSMCVGCTSTLAARAAPRVCKQNLQSKPRSSSKPKWRTTRCKCICRAWTGVLPGVALPCSIAMCTSCKGA